MGSSCGMKADTGSENSFHDKFGFFHTAGVSVTVIASFPFTA